MYRCNLLLSERGDPQPSHHIPGTGQSFSRDEPSIYQAGRDPGIEPAPPSEHLSPPGCSLKKLTAM